MRARSTAVSIKLGIRQKMIVVLLGVLTIALATTGWFTMRQYNENVLHETQQRGDELARFVSESLVFNVVGYDYHTIQLLLDKLTGYQDIVFAEVKNTRGNIMGSSGTLRDDAHTTMFVKELIFDDAQVGELRMVLDQSRIVRNLDAQKNDLIRREVLTILLIAIGEFAALSYIIIRPVKIISRSLGPAEHTEAVPRIPLNSDDEFGVLARKFNEIRAQLGDANIKLQSKIDLADERLKETNEQLRRQSDDLKQMNEELKRLSITDPLTGLYNRREFEQLMSNEILLSLRHNEPNSILMIDIDHFKSINDTYGHQAGDRVLRRVAHLLTQNLRRSDIICRIGGEEFVALCRRVTHDQAMVVGEKIRAAIEFTEMPVDDKMLRVTVSIGIASIPNQYDATTTDELLEQADSALYFSKTRGRNRVTHYARVAAKMASEKTDS